MDELALILFKCSLAGYAAGAVMGLLLLRFEKLATVFGFGIASLSALCGLVSSVISLAGGGALSQGFEISAFAAHSGSGSYHRRSAQRHEALPA